MRRRREAESRHDRLVQRVEAERRSHLGQGRILIEAAVRARVLGFQLLRLDADVVLTPVREVSPTLRRRALPVSISAQEPPGARHGPAAIGPGEGSFAERSTERSQDASAPARPMSRGSIADARRSLAAADRSLAQARRASEQDS